MFDYPLLEVVRISLLYKVKYKNGYWKKCERLGWVGLYGVIGPSSRCKNLGVGIDRTITVRRTVNAFLFTHPAILFLLFLMGSAE